MTKPTEEEFDSRLEIFMQENKVQGDIQYPIEVSEVKTCGVMKTGEERVGLWVSVRPVSDDKTYLGVYLGDLPSMTFHSYNTRTKVLSVVPRGNPAIYVPDLMRVVWGYEAWWGIIDSPEKLRRISDADIQNVWYVKALKELQKEGA